MVSGKRGKQPRDKVRKAAENQTTPVKIIITLILQNNFKRLVPFSLLGLKLIFFPNELSTL